jgi:hypothetical protein
MVPGHDGRVVRPTLVVAAGLIALAACSNGSNTGVEGDNCVGNSCSHGTTGKVFEVTGGASSSGGSGTSGGASSAGSASSNGSSSGGTLGTSSGGGSSGGQTITCSNITAFTGDGGFCPGTWYGTRYADLGTCAEIVGATVEALDQNAVPIASATTDATGDFVFCLPAGSVYTPYVQAAGYPPSYLAQQNAPPRPEWIGLVSTGTLAVVTGIQSYNSADGVVAVFFHSSAACQDQSGWNVTLQLPDGGALPDGGYEMLYLDPDDLPDPDLTATTSSGSAIALNVDTTLVTYVAVSISNPDAGACGDQSAELGGTGLVYVEGNALSYFAPYLDAP